DALAKPTDEKAIESADETISNIFLAEKPALDDDVEITEEARRQTPKLVRLLKAPQVAGWIARNAESIGDPRDLLMSSLTAVRTLTGMEFSACRDEVSEEVGRLTAGIQSKKAEEIHDLVFRLLTRAHDCTDDEFKAQAQTFEKEAAEITGRISATDVMRN